MNFDNCLAKRQLLLPTEARPVTQQDHARAAMITCGRIFGGILFAAGHRTLYELMNPRKLIYPVPRDLYGV